MASSRPDSQAPSSEDLLRQAKFGAPNSSPASSSSSPAYAPTSDSILYGGAYDPARLHPLSGLNLNKGDDGELDWLDIEDDKLNTLEGTKGLLPNRGWGDELCYGTGTTYLSGLGLGGVWGLREGFAKPLKTATPRLRLNTILNSVTRRGSFLGNNAGVLALMYNIFNSSLDKYRGKHDVYGSMTAGGLTGALFKCTAGVRPMVIASAGLTVAAAAWTSFKATLL